MKTEAIIDYLQYTAVEIPDWLGEIPYISKSPLAFYQACYEFPCGTRVFQGNANSELVLVQLPGKACEQHKVMCHPQRFQAVFDEQSKFSRVDFAVTVEGLEPLFWFYEAMKKDVIVSKRFEGDAPKAVTDRFGNPETIYIGDLKKRGRKGVFRAYNKGLELGIDKLLTRFELEVRKKSAQVAMRRILLGVSIPKIITDVIDMPGIEWWKDIMGAKGGDLPVYHPPEKPDPIARRWHWLIKQVAPALGRLIAINDQHKTALYQEFLSTVEASRASYHREHLERN